MCYAPRTMPPKTANAFSDMRRELSDDDREHLESVRGGDCYSGGSAEESQLPIDPALTIDALALRKMGRTSAELLKGHAIGLWELSASQLAACRALLPYEHRAQTTKVQSEVTVNGIDPTLAATLGIATPEERARLKAEALAALGQAPQVH